MALQAALLGVAMLVGVALMFRWFTTAPPKDVLKVLKWLAFAVVVGAILVLVLAGRLGWALGALPLLAPWILQLVRLRRQAKTYARMAGIGGGGQTSDVETAWLRMSLDHDSGELDGEVTQGPYAGRRLGELSVADLVALLRSLWPVDEESARVLEAYMDRVHSDWRDTVRRAEDAQGDHAARGGEAMTEAEALAVLGLDETADAAAIRTAHHRLIASLHPDKGGSTYLAAKINAAKDLLLKRRR